MQVITVKVGVLKTNCYILVNNDKCLVIDPGDEYLKIKKEIGDRLVVGVIITHHHFDHIGALEELVQNSNVRVYDKSNLHLGENRIDDFTFDVIYTPGHKEDLISIYFKEENELFCGDFIFEGTIGRWDLVGGSKEDMKKSIKNILRFNDDMIIYPGHGNKTTMHDERKNLNYYLSVI